MGGLVPSCLTTFIASVFNDTDHSYVPWPMTPPSSDEIRSKVCTRAFGSPVVQNDFRGIVAEAIVGAALGVQWKWCSGNWNGWDFEHLDKTKLEVKQSAAQQTHASEKRSPPGFEISSRTGYYDDETGKWQDRIGRNADIYVFAYHPIEAPGADHFSPEQWRFHVVEAERLPAQKTIRLTKVSALSPAIMWNELSSVVEELHVARMKTG